MTEPCDETINRIYGLFGHRTLVVFSPCCGYNNAILMSDMCFMNHTTQWQQKCAKRQPHTPTPTFSPRDPQGTQSDPTLRPVRGAPSAHQYTFLVTPISSALRQIGTLYIIQIQYPCAVPVTSNSSPSPFSSALSKNVRVGSGEWVWNQRRRTWVAARPRFLESSRVQSVSTRSAGLAGD